MIAPPERAHRILVADDDATTRTVVAAVLDLAGYLVVTATDAGAARTLLDDGGLDAAVLDRTLATAAGPTVLDASDARRAPPVVLLTDAAAGPPDVDPLDAGAAAMIATPCAPQHLLDVLAHVVGDVDG